MGRRRLRRDLRDDEPGDRRADRRLPEVGAEDVDRAVEAAQEAYEEWRLVPAPRRGEILYRFGALVREHKDEVAVLMSREMGKVLPEAAATSRKRST